MPGLTRFYGRNGSRAPTEIQDAEATVLQNFFLSGHSLQQRKGKTQEFQDSANLTNPIWGLHRSYIVDGSPFWIWSSGTTLRSLRTGSQVTLKNWSASNKGVGFVEAKGSIYVLSANTTDKIQKTDGTAGGTADHGSANAPKASIGIYHNNRLFVNDLNNFERVWFSDTNDPDTFRNQTTSAVATEGGYIQVSNGDGDRIKGIGKLGSVLFFFKERSIHMLLGSSFTGDETFRLIEIARGIGTKSPRSVTTVENGLFFMDSDGFLRYFYGPSRKITAGLGRPIEDLTTEIPTTYLEEAAGGYFDRKFFLSFAGSGQTKNTEAWALDMRAVTPGLTSDEDADLQSGWTELTGVEWNQFVVTNGQSDTALPYFADSTANGKVWKFLSGTTDDGAAIPYAWKSKAYGADAPTTVKMLSEFSSVTRTTSTAVTHEAYANLASSATATKSLTPANTTHSVNTWRPPASVLGSTVQVGLSGSSSVGAEILSVEWDWSSPRREPIDG